MLSLEKNKTFAARYRCDDIVEAWDKGVGSVSAPVTRNPGDSIAHACVESDKLRVPTYDERMGR